MCFLTLRIFWTKILDNITNNLLLEHILCQCTLVYPLFFLAIFVGWQPL